MQWRWPTIYCSFALPVSHQVLRQGTGTYTHFVQYWLQNSRFIFPVRKARGAVSVNSRIRSARASHARRACRACEAKKRLSPALLAVSTLKFARVAS